MTHRSRTVHDDIEFYRSVGARCDAPGSPASTCLAGGSTPAFGHF